MDPIERLHKAAVEPNSKMNGDLYTEVMVDDLSIILRQYEEMARLLQLLAKEQGLL